MKEQKGGFLICFRYIRCKFIRKSLTGKGALHAGKGVKKKDKGKHRPGEGIVRTGEGNNNMDF